MSRDHAKRRVLTYKTAAWPDALRQTLGVSDGTPMPEVINTGTNDLGYLVRDFLDPLPVPAAGSGN